MTYASGSLNEAAYHLNSRLKKFLSDLSHSAELGQYPITQDYKHDLKRIVEVISVSQRKCDAYVLRNEIAKSNENETVAELGRQSNQIVTTTSALQVKKIIIRERN